MSRVYLQAHSGDKPDTKAKTIKDILGANRSKEFDEVVKFVKDQLGE